MRPNKNPSKKSSRPDRDLTEAHWLKKLSSLPQFLGLETITIRNPLFSFNDIFFPLFLPKFWDYSALAWFSLALLQI